jgi:ABC-type nitrate/sulfonate/bicarbonate transport system substrate-binding protein
MHAVAVRRASTTWRAVAVATVLLGALALGLSWRRLGRAPPAAPPSPPTLVRIGVSEGFVAASVLVAEARGAFAANHLEAAVHVYPDGRAALAGLLRGEVEAALTGDLPIARASLDRPDLVVLAVVGRSKEDRWLVARPGAGIATSADLAGKRIGTQKRSGSHYVLGRVLEHRGIAPTDVAVVDLPVEGMAKALAGGDIDAFTTEHPFPGPAALHYGTEVVELHDPEAYELTYDLVSMQKLAGRTEATDLLRALADADAFVRAQPEAAVDVVATRLGVVREKIAVAAQAFLPDFGLDPRLARALDGEARWFIAQGWGPAREPRGDLVDARSLLAARPALVRTE